ncbi:Ribosomal protein S18 acetylase RimI [Maridesulfovibrio ferrireducens]|uniref:Ribosomal protein S18 acetylase RimI n=1 Tax=Maridesulfovibrio ferrireducens TaxID=246191 RepID=A0A1G9E7Z7_9BACT|nr:GNAT family N-acetyltransferase [Maridesulfovibrio ferrireducens]SDK72273.1 Ribosomal protein S18 acetylase RimI [Maridesulfovibrio ferrireducens]
MVIKFVELIQSDFEDYSTISVFEHQAQFVFPIAKVLSRFSGRNAEKHVYIAGAKCDGEAAGIIIVTNYYETAELKSKKLNVCWVDTLATDRKYQKQGIGSKLLEHAISALCGKFDCMCLTVNVRNEAAKSMYIKCGFEDVGELYLGGLSGPQNILRYNLSGS